MKSTLTILAVALFAAMSLTSTAAIAKGGARSAKMSAAAKADAKADKRLPAKVTAPKK